MTLLWDVQTPDVEVHIGRGSFVSQDLKEIFYLIRDLSFLDGFEVGIEVIGVFTTFGVNMLFC